MGREMVMDNAATIIIWLIPTLSHISLMET